MKNFNYHNTKFLKNQGFFSRINPCLSPRKKNVLFLDRDGVVNCEVGHILDKSQIILNRKIFPVLKYYSSKHWTICIVTNQSSIGRGWLSFTQYFDLTNYIMNELYLSTKVNVDCVLTCPFHPEGINIYRLSNCKWRKPNAGMLEYALQYLKVERRNAIMYGDRVTDFLAAKKSRVKFRWV